MFLYYHPHLFICISIFSDQIKEVVVIMMVDMIVEMMVEEKEDTE
jgi:hypothetical protein